MRTQADRILDKLEAAGDQGVLNIDLMPIAWRYSARIADLRKDGHRIRSTHVKNAVWRFTLLPSDPLDAVSTHLLAEFDDPECMDMFNEQLRTFVSNCCGEPINIFGFCGGCHEHV
jgi:hypothetical protein